MVKDKPITTQKQMKNIIKVKTIYYAFPKRISMKAKEMPN